MKICPFCAEEIREEAIKCRYCGEFLEETQLPPSSGSVKHGRVDESLSERKARSQLATRSALFGGLVILVIGVGLLTNQIQSPDSQPAGIAREDGDPLTAFRMSQAFIKERLKAPSTAEFPQYDESFVTRLGPGRYEVSAYVDSQNSFAAQIRNHYTCVVATNDGENWTLESFRTENIADRPNCVAVGNGERYRVALKVCDIAAEFGFYPRRVEVFPEGGIDIVVTESQRERWARKPGELHEAASGLTKAIRDNTNAFAKGVVLDIRALSGSIAHTYTLSQEDRIRTLTF